MLHKLKRMFAFLCAAALVLSASACGQDKASGGQGVAGDADSPYKVSDEPITLSFFYAADNKPFDDNYPVFKEAARLTNVTLHGTVPQSNSEGGQAFATMMASGNVDDIVTTSKSSFDKYATSGAFVALDPLIDEYAPDIKKFLDDNPNLRKMITEGDGHIYFLPRFEQGDAAQGWYIRQDWLDKLGLEQPKTVDEFYEVLKAFRDRDPNGNGEQDEIPYFHRQKNLNALYNLMGICTGFSYNEKTGHVEHGSYTEAYKNAVKTVAQWYKEGLIDREIFTRGNNAREELLGNNTGGITHDWFTSTDGYNQKLEGSVPGINFAAFPPPADVNGVQWEETSRAQSTLKGWGIASSNEHPIETIKYFNFWYTDAGYRLANYGVEGTHYDLVDGKPVFKQEFLNTTKSMTEAWWSDGIALYIGYVQDFDAEKQWMSPITVDAFDMYVSNKYIREAFPLLSFTEDEQKVITAKWSAIETYMKEQEQKWIFGTDDVDATFDQYMAQCKQLGMDEVLAVYDAAYERYLNS